MEIAIIGICALVAYKLGGKVAAFLVTFGILRSL